MQFIPIGFGRPYSLSVSLTANLEMPRRFGVQTRGRLPDTPLHVRPREDAIDCRRERDGAVPLLQLIGYPRKRERPGSPGLSRYALRGALTG
jgi:hypothetical protein